MFPSSLAVIAAGLVLGALALAAFAWAWWTGAFRRLDRQAREILDKRDLRLERPWESAPQQAERVTAYGELLEREFVTQGAVFYKYVPVEMGFPKGDVAARAAECAAEQGAFRPMQDQLYANQTEWKRTTGRDGSACAPRRRSS